MNTNQQSEVRAHIIAGHPDVKIASFFGVSRHAVARYRRKLAVGKCPVEQSKPEPTESELLTQARRLLATPSTLLSLQEGLGVGPAKLEELFGHLEAEGCLARHGHFFSLERPAFGRLPLSFLNGSKEITLGLVADTHLACKEERLSELHAVYDLFAKEGITHVLHAGNIVDGYVPRINGASVKVSDIDGQCLYTVDNYPKRAGMVTHFITGDDHEGWWQKEGFNFGFYLQQVAQREGREDLHYIGHVEGDVAVTTREGLRPIMVKVQHPGGGSSYARSYTGQKQAEAFQGGEKPDILIQGHYHVANYMPERNVHVIGMPGFQDQTVFARKKRLRMEVGGAILRFRATEQGALSRVSVEYIMFYNRGFYTPFLRSDSRLIKGKFSL